MAKIFDRKHGAKDSDRDLLQAIHKVASDKNTRILDSDSLEWERTKMKEIKRLTKILLDRIQGKSSSAA